MSPAEIECRCRWEFPGADYLAFEDFGEDFGCAVGFNRKSDGELVRFALRVGSQCKVHELYGTFGFPILHRRIEKSRREGYLSQ